MSLSPKARSIVYLLSVFVNGTVAVLVTEIELSVWALAPLAGFNAVVALLAKSNVNEV